MISWEEVHVQSNAELARVLSETTPRFTVQKISYTWPVSIELLLDDRGDLFGRKPGTYTYGWEPWLAKEWFKRGHGEGKRGPKGKLP